MIDYKLKVEQATHALLLRGEKPTLQLVRKEAGGGSPNLYGPPFREWREKRIQAEIAAKEAPKEMLEIFNRIGGQVWNECQKLGRRNIDAIWNHSQELQQEFESELQDVRNELSAVKIARDDAAQIFENMRQQLADAIAQQRVAELSNEKLRLEIETERDASTQARIRVEKVQTTLTLLERRIKEIEQVNSVLQTDLSAARDEASNLRGQLTRGSHLVK
ncbi:MAG: DNA-binding protein [Pseudomonadota bacterium]